MVERKFHISPSTRSICIKPPLTFHSYTGYVSIGIYNLANTKLALMRDFFFAWATSRRRHRALRGERKRPSASRRRRRRLLRDCRGLHSLALRRDGSIACWGRIAEGQAPPEGVAGDFVAIAAGDLHSLALRRDGSIACWGNNANGQAPPV